MSRSRRWATLTSGRSAAQPGVKFATRWAAAERARRGRRQIHHHGRHRAAFRSSNAKAGRRPAAENLIFGEMTCMSNYPRATTVTTMDDDCTVLEIRNINTFAVHASRRLRTVMRPGGSIWHLQSVSYSPLVAMPPRWEYGQGDNVDGDHRR